MTVLKISVVFSASALTSAMHLMTDLSLNKPSSVAVAGYSWQLSEAYSRGLHLLQIRQSQI